jgi:integrase
MYSQDRRAPGIRARHSRRCARPAGSCCCKPSYQASVYDARSGKRIRKTFPTFAAAKGWQRDGVAAVARGELRMPTRATIADTAVGLVEGMASGAIRTRGGQVFKPSTVRTYEIALRMHILPLLGRLRLSDLRRADVQYVVEQLNASGRDPSTTRNALMPLRLICRRALVRQDIAVNPMTGLELPAVRGRRTPEVSREAVAQMIEALPELDRALWTLAFLAGPRLGELQALRWEDVDLDNGRLRIERSWDRVAGPVSPKSHAGNRFIPLPTIARRRLIEHRLRSGRTDGLVFGRDGVRPFEPTSALTRARKVWGALDVTPVTFHEARHIAGSLMLDAGVPLTSVSRFLGHGAISITADRYNHLVVGADLDAAARLDIYIGGAGAS